MLKDSEIRPFSQELRTGSEIYEDTDYITVEGVKIRYPYSGFSCTNGRGYNCPSVVWESRNNLYDLFHNDFPQEWIPFIKEIDEKRKSVGNDTPINLVIGTVFVIEENLKYAEKIGLEPYKRSEDGYRDYRDIPKLVETINTIINDQFLNTRLTTTLIRQIDDCGGYWDENDTILKICKDLATQGKQILDIGIGTGEKTSNRSTESGVKTIGIERQFHPEYYGPYWGNENPNIQFVRADANEAIPLKSNSIDFALMECVVAHITLDSLDRILTDVKRVLKPGGILMVGPEKIDREKEEYSGESRWRYFVKVNSEEKTVLKQINLKDVSKIIGIGNYEEDYLL